MRRLGFLSVLFLFAVLPQLSYSAGGSCGNGQVNPGEQCGEPGLSCPTGQTCNLQTCTCSAQGAGAGGLCGNGLWDPGEECNEPGLICPTGKECDVKTCQCTQGAAPPSCGNGILNPGEQCELGIDCSGAWESCDLQTCQCEPKNLECGNGVLEGNEQCETGISCANRGEKCNLTLCTCEAQPENLCGNGQLDEGEECDAQENSNCQGYACTGSCICLASCTDGSDCADGYRCQDGQCRADLGQAILDQPRCGDGILNGQEQCDYAGAYAGASCAPGYSCADSCTCERSELVAVRAVIPGCGNGQVDQGEECDSGLLQEGGGCEEGYECTACSCIPLPREQSLPDYSQSDTILAIGLFASILIIALAYMAGNFLNSPQLLFWSKSELREIFQSVLIIILVTTGLAASDFFVRSITGSQNIQEEAITHLDYFINNSVGAINYFSEASFYISKRASFSYSVTTPLIPFFLNKYSSQAPASGLSALIPPIYGAIDNLSKIIYAFEIQKMLIAFFSALVPTILLPIAFVLRTFPLTRKIGATMIAVCIGAILWFPAGVIFASQTYREDFWNYNPYAKEGDPCWQGAQDNPCEEDAEIPLGDYLNRRLSLSSLDPGDPPVAGQICSPYWSAFFGLGEDLNAAILCLPVVWLPPVYESCRQVMVWVVRGLYQGFPLAFEPHLRNFASLSQQEVLEKFYLPLTEQLLPPLSEFYVHSLISILITIFTTVVMTKGTAEVLGGESRIYGISRLI